MQEQQVSLADWQRLLLGRAPVAFIAEILVRVVVVYLFLLVVVRLLGKRMSGQITNLELGVMMVLGGIVAVPLEIADRGMLPGLLLLLTILLLQHTFAAVQTRSPRAERALLGHASALVRDGVVQIEELRRAAISQQQLFSTLRGAKIRQLGELSRVYLEAYGFFSLRKREEPEPGLSVLPLDDPELSARLEADPERCACGYCGRLAPRGTSDPCPNCHHRDFGPAVRLKDEDAKA